MSVLELHLPTAVVLLGEEEIEGSIVLSFRHVSGHEIATLMPSDYGYEDLEDVQAFLRQWSRAF